MGGNVRKKSKRVAVDDHAPTILQHVQNLKQDLMSDLHLILSYLIQSHLISSHLILQEKITVKSREENPKNQKLPILRQPFRSISRIPLKTKNQVISPDLILFLPKKRG